ncbi:MAG: RsmE family RNA methyltransferase [Actinomycetota bacterium]
MSNDPWFHAAPERWARDEIVLPPDESHHAARVVRVAPPDVITVTDGAGRVARAAVRHVEAERVLVEVLDEEVRPRLRPEIVVYQGAAKSGKLDDVVERLAELGVAEMWAFESERTVARWDPAKVSRLGDRWRAVARSAGKQSHNPYFLKAGAGVSWTELLRRVAKEPLGLTMWEGASLPMRTALLEQADRVAIVVGPEGGLTKDEAAALADSGAPLVSLGPRILRTENASIVAATALLFHYGLIG